MLSAHKYYGNAPTRKNLFRKTRENQRVTVCNVFYVQFSRSSVQSRCFAAFRKQRAKLRPACAFANDIPNTNANRSLRAKTVHNTRVGKNQFRGYRVEPLMAFYATWRCRYITETTELYPSRVL